MFIWYIITYVYMVIYCMYIYVILFSSNTWFKLSLSISEWSKWTRHSPQMSSVIVCAQLFYLIREAEALVNRVCDRKHACHQSWVPFTEPIASLPANKSNIYARVPRSNRYTAMFDVRQAQVCTIVASLKWRHNLTAPHPFSILPFGQ